MEAMDFPEAFRESPKEATGMARIDVTKSVKGSPHLVVVSRAICMGEEDDCYSVVLDRNPMDGFSHQEDDRPNTLRFKGASDREIFCIELSDESLDALAEMILDHTTKVGNVVTEE